MKPRGYWTLETCSAEAAQYPTRGAWDKGHASSYNTARRLGILEQCCGHMTRAIKPMGYWTLARCKADAAKYSNRVDWIANSSAASSAAYENDWISKCCGHMERSRKQSTCVYIWKAIGQHYNGKQVYKIGIAGETRGSERISSCSKSMGFEAELLIMATVGSDAAYIEEVLHILGDNPQYVEGAGRTEFRALSTLELGEAIDLIKASILKDEALQELWECSV